MKRIFPLLLFCACLWSIGQAQVKDSVVEKLMTKRALNCTDIYYNTISLIPQLYHEGKTDTINAIIDYTHRNCEVYTATAAYVLLRSVQQHDFREAIYKNSDTVQVKGYYENNIIGLLNSYVLGSKRNGLTALNTGEAYALQTVQRDYNSFIKTMALSLITRTDLTPVEQFIVDIYAHPESAKFDKLKSSAYKGSLLQKAYYKTAGDDGFEYNFFYGGWKPFGKLAVLGDHPIVGCFIGARQNGFSGGMTFSVGFNKSPNIYQVKKNDSIFSTDHFVQYYVGYDFGQALYSNRRTEFTLNAGLGYDGINALTKKGDANVSRTLGSFNWNLGAGFKVFLNKRDKDGNISRSYIGVQAKYNFVSYNNRSGTDLTGRSACFSLTFGGFTFSHPVHYDRLLQPWRVRCWG